MWILSCRCGLDVGKRVDGFSTSDGDGFDSGCKIFCEGDESS